MVRGHLGEGVSQLKTYTAGEMCMDTMGGARGQGCSGGSETGQNGVVPQKAPISGAHVLTFWLSLPDMPR